MKSDEYDALYGGDGEGPADDEWIHQAYENQHPRVGDGPVRPHWTSTFNDRRRSR